MKKNLFTTLLLLFLVTTSVSQTSVGIKNHDNLESILSYRLPQWGYSTLYLNTNGSASNSKLESDNNKNKYYDYNFLLIPSLKGYQESEKYIRKYDIGLDLSTSYSLSDQDDYSEEILNMQKELKKYSSNFSFKGSLNQYIWNNTFILIRGDGWAKYYENRTEEKNTYNPNYGSSITYNTKYISKGYMLDGEIGVGIGRVRDITPLLKAVRLRERYESLKDTSLISDEEIQLIARDIAKISGYNVTYDREDKYFWGNLFNHIDNITLISPFEIYYLTDVLHENLGTRFEGWDISIGASANNIKKISRTLGAFGQGRWYKNLTLEQQVSLDITSSFLKYLDKKYSAEYKGYCQIELKYLRVLSDRILWESKLRSSYSTSQYNRTYSGKKIWYRYYSRSLNSTFSYYIENNVRFNCSFSYSFDQDDSSYKTNRNSFGINFGLYYYFDRKLL